MQNVNTEIDIAHGLDASLRDASAPVIINEAEKSALAVKALSDRNPGQVQIIEVPRLRTVGVRN